MVSEPAFSSERNQDELRVTLTGAWTIAGSKSIEDAARALVAEARGMSQAVLDLSQVERMDTAGAWLIGRCRAQLEAAGASIEYAQAKPEYEILLKEAAFRSFSDEKPRPRSLLIDVLADVGGNVISFGKNMLSGVAFLGEVIASMAKSIVRPTRFRGTSVIFHIETFAFRGLPIIALINFLVGCIVAQQSIFQLQKFGAATFAVDLIGILVLRELAVLLTSIMVAGRSGSAITAELGSMKMREEIDALRVMGLDPIDVLVMPRILALVISLPLLTFLSDMSAIFGGLLVAWFYGGISPEVFMARLQSAIAMNTFLVGMIKAPFMALVIGMIAAMEGLATQGSAESLGRQVTSSVVKSIFMVILVDGLFAMFFASIAY
ncbi:MAG: MlaE family lipid ABC transporter permease subunit [Beijerinckiaceae bacterium]|nr:MlaE family lipid ABC transporter permease subunit [Beijerinckiaceae bacterium]MDO9441510.1 MlaE family lipid ABC transporter permease subunit [Beijerinckiaceae bacterium]